ncbi:hypothetical protein P9112_014051 [Eukaryota sp. TZLM1-RC]
MTVNMTESVILLINGEKHEIINPRPDLTLADYLRSDEVRLKGTKIATGEGATSASTVLVTYYDTVQQKPFSKAILASIVPVFSLHKTAITTIEGLGAVSRKSVHELQQSFADNYGAQCGYCTPGIIMNLYTVLRDDNPSPNPTFADIEDTLQSSMCRCTGYRAIYDSVEPFVGEGRIPCERTAKTVKSVEPTFPADFMTLDDVMGCQWAVASSLQVAMDLINKGYTPIGGNNEIRLAHMTDASHPEKVVYIGRVKELRNIVINDPSETHQSITIGSGITVSELKDVFNTLSSDSKGTGVKRISSNLFDHLNDFGTVQVRNSSTIGGHLMTSSRYSDLLPVFEVLGGQLTFIDPKDGSSITCEITEALNHKGKLLTNVVLNLPIDDTVMFSAAKVAKRRTNALCVASIAFLYSKNGTKLAVNNLEEGLSTGFENFVKSIGENLDVSKSLSALVTDLHSLSIVNDSQGTIEFRKTVTLSITKLIMDKLSQFLTGDVSAANQSRVITSKGLGMSFPLISTRKFEQIPMNNPTEITNQPVKPIDSTLICTGESSFTRDMVTTKDTLHAAFVTSQYAHANILSIDHSKAKEALGDSFIEIVTAKDITGSDGLTGIVFDTMAFANGTVHYAGQPIAVVVCDTPENARKAASLVCVDYEELEPILSVEDAYEKGSFHPHIASRVIKRGDVNAVLEGAKTKDDEVYVEGTIKVGGQEHFYFEPQVAIASPGDPLFTVHSSTQNVAKVQADVAKVLGIPMHKVLVKVFRLGGGFGGKQDRPCFIACAASVAANKLNRPVRLALDRRTDIAITGGRHPFTCYYKAACKKSGELLGADIKFLMNGGYVFDVTGPVMEKTVMQMESVYKWPSWRTEGIGCKTNMVTNTAYRGFGAPQANIITETVITHLANEVGIDLLTFRDLNLLSNGYETILGCYVDQGVVAPETCALPKMWKDFKQSSEIQRRIQSVEEFNANNSRFKRGISLNPQKCAVCFEVDFMNAGACLLNVYHDGSVQLAVSAVEMGQGVFTKMAQLCSHTLGIPFEMVHVVETSTDRNPNTQPTSASSGSDVAGPAVIKACKMILERLEPLRKQFPEASWKELCFKAYFKRIDLRAGTHHALPELEWSWDKYNSSEFTGTSIAAGTAGFYYSYGIACAEVQIDTYTGEWALIRADVLQDAGRSLNPLLDIGQVEGSFVQGLGYYTTEEMKYNDQGLIVNAPGDYLLPTVNEIPREWHVELVAQQPNEMNVAGSKATAEGPLINASSVLFALLDGINNTRKANNKEILKTVPCSPMTTEVIRMSLGDELVV